MLLQVTTTSPPTTAPPDVATVVETVTQGCRETGGFLCERVYDWTGNETVSNWTAFLLDKPLKILVIALVAAIANRIARRAIRGMTKTIASTTGPETRAAGMLVSARTAERSKQRADTLGTVLRSVASVFIWSIAVMMILGELGVDLAPLIAGAGIAGIALGFGAQSLVRDVLSGFFLLLEDQFGVGDLVDIGDAVGTVEQVTLRVTTVRDVNGTLWHVPNGQILRVANKSQLWARAVVDVTVATGTDIDAASAVIKQAADDLWHDLAYAPSVREEPEVLGVENFVPDGITLRLVVKTDPTAQFAIERELRARVRQALDEAGISFPLTRTVLVQSSGDEPQPPSPT